MAKYTDGPNVLGLSVTVYDISTWSTQFNRFTSFPVIWSNPGNERFLKYLIYTCSMCNSFYGDSIKGNKLFYSTLYFINKTHWLINHVPAFDQSNRYFQLCARLQQHRPFFFNFSHPSEISYKSEVILLQHVSKHVCVNALDQQWNANVSSPSETYHQSQKALEWVDRWYWNGQVPWSGFFSEPKVTRGTGI